MKITKILGFVCLINLLFGACISSSVHTQKNQNITSTPVELDKNNQANIQAQPRKRVVIENLANGNYRFCSEPASQENINDFAEEAWCFEFNKKGDIIVGTYSYQAPKDTAQICIEGLAKHNRVNGVGYEIVQYGETKPDIEKEKLKISQDTSFMSKRDFWDDSDVYQGGFNLKVDSPHFYKLLPPEQEGNSYWAWIRFDIAELNLSRFYQRELRKYRYKGDLQEVIPVSKCVD